MQKNMLFSFECLISIQMNMWRLDSFASSSKIDIIAGRSGFCVRMHLLNTSILFLVKEFICIHSLQCMVLNSD